MAAGVAGLEAAELRLLLEEEHVTETLESRELKGGAATKMAAARNTSRASPDLRVRPGPQLTRLIPAARGFEMFEEIRDLVVPSPPAPLRNHQKRDRKNGDDRRGPAMSDVTAA